MQFNSKINLFQVKDFGGLFQLFFDFTKQNYGAIIKGIAYLIPLVIVISFLSQSIQSDTFEGNVGGNFFLKYFVLIFLVYIPGLLSGAFTICYMAKYAESENGEVSMGEVWSRVKSIVFPFLGYYIVYGITVVIGVMFCLIPGVFIGINFIFIGFIYAIEDRGSIIDVFQRSWDLVKNNWFLVFGFLFVIGMMAGLVNVIFTIPTYLGQFAMYLNWDLLNNDIYQFLAISISQVSALFIGPLSMIATGILYFSRKSDVDNIVAEDNIDLIGKSEYPQ